MRRKNSKAIFSFSKRAFTLIELLLVLAILGVMAAIVVPRISSGMVGTRLSTSARSVIQAARYARTMALLHQTETELVLSPEAGKIRVQARTGSGYIAQQLEAIERERKEADALGSRDDRTMPEEAELVALTNRSSDIATAKTITEEIETEFESDGITYSFHGYTDTVEEPTANTRPSDGAPVRVFFRSNGTCRPFRLRVMDRESPDDYYMDISIDAMGAGKIEREENL